MSRPAGESANLDLFRYLAAEERGEYITIMSLFTASLLADMSAATVAEHLVAEGTPLSADVVENRCKQLVRWGNLVPSLRDARVSTVAEYLRARSRYQVSTLGGRVHRGAIEIIAASDGAREVARELLGQIVEALEEIPALLDAGVEGERAQRLAGIVTTIFNNQRLFTASVTDFYAYLSGVLSRFDLGGEEYALDNDRLAGRLAIRALAFALDRPEPSSPRDRIALWQSAGITVDTVSGTVLTWGLRPPGVDRWSEMMRMRADLGLVTHLTLAELTTFTASLTEPGATIAACENPQVLQRAAEAGVQQPLLCFSGNPSSAGLAVAERVRLRYHGDFDWPGIAIAARLYAGGADLWRMTTHDYLRATTSDATRLPLTGAPLPTPWEPELSPSMTRVGMVVHEEAVLEDLLADLL
ncbi:DUF2397 family protein [Nocardia sp. R7R-8]|uniref:DUF2397 family protein n=1 Tax=Nocardia sp. R7R-8 TaxID=3459304 RepID=UPI00403DBF1F